MSETVTILFRKRNESAYEIQVKESWSGRTVLGDFTPPYTGRQILTLHKKLNKLESDDRELRIIGETLFSALCGEEASEPELHDVPMLSVRAVLRSVIKRALARRGTVALTLCFELACNEFVQYPWELLHNGNLFLLASGIFTLTRALIQPNNSDGCDLPVRLPMRVLYIGSSPSDVRSLELEKSFTALANGFSVLTDIDPGLIQLDQLNPPTYDQLVTYLSDVGGAGKFNDEKTSLPCYVIHFDGHGAFGKLCKKEDCGQLNDPSAQKCVDCGASLKNTKAQTYLSFCSEDGCNRYIDTQALRELLVSSDVRLAVFSACETATVGTVLANKRQVAAVDLTLATGLVTAEVPAVVAMPFSVHDDISPTFMFHFYESLAKGQTLEEALTRARQALLQKKNKSWFVPVLYRHVVEGKEGPVALITKDESDGVNGHGHSLAHLDAPNNYVGREKELHDLTELLLLTISDEASTKSELTKKVRPGTHHFALTGSPGIGKSALACEAASRNKDKFPGGIIAVSLQGGKSFADALLEILHELPNPPQSSTATDNKYRMQAVLNAFRTSANRDLPCLLLIDRFDEVKEADANEQWLQFLCALPQKVVVLVTSRYNPGAAISMVMNSCRWYEYHVDKMKSEDLMQLFLDLASSTGLDQRIHLNEPEQSAILKEICDLLDGYPLGAELIFGATHSIDGQLFSPEAATKPLAEIRDELSSTPLAGINAVLSVAYNRLSPIARLLLCYLSAFKLPFSHEQINMLVAHETVESTGEAIRLIQQPEGTLGSVAVASMTSFDLAKSWNDARSELVNASFMQFDGRVYKIHSQVRHFAIGHLPMEERKRVHRLVATYYSSLLQPSHEEWLVAVEHLESAGETRDLQEAILVAIKASKVLGGRGHAQELLAMLRRANVHASRLGDKRGEGQIQCSIGAILRQLGQYADAEACLRSSLDFYNAENLSDESGWALYELAMLFREEGDFKQAQGYAQEAMQIFQERDDHRGEAWMQLVYGEIQRGIGAYYDARGHFEAALTNFKTLRNKEGIASVLRSRGTVFESTGEHTAALHDYEEAFRIFNELGLRASQAWVLVDKSIVLTRKGHLDEAQAMCMEAIATFHEQGIRRGEAWARRALGDVLRRHHKLDEARIYYNESEALCRALGARVDHAHVLNSLGAIAFDENEFSDAHEYYEESLEIAREQGARQIEERALRGLGDIALASHQFHEAKRYFETASSIAVALDMPIEKSAVLRRKGMLAQEQKQYYDALDNFVNALALDARLEHPANEDIQARVSQIVSEQHLQEEYLMLCQKHNYVSDDFIANE